MKEVFYVEDSALSQVLLRKYLGSLCNLTVVGDLRAAEAVLKDRSFDLLITDFMFREGTALDFIRNTRRRFSIEQMPIIVISGAMDPILTSQVMQAGANDTFSKPLKAAEFKTAVERMLQTPYVKSHENAVVGVRCFQWKIDDCFFQFCPELNFTTSGATAKEAGQLMRKAVQDRASEGQKLGLTNNEAIAMHIVQY